MEDSPYIGLFCGNCMDLFSTVSDKSIDAIVTDPPYNVSVKNSVIRRNNSIFTEKSDIRLDFGEWDQRQIVWTDYIDQFVRVLTDVDVLVMFYDKLYLGSIGIYLQEKYDCQVRHIGNYVKTNPAPQALRVKWQNGCESFLVVTRNKKSGHHFNYNLGQSPDYFMRSVNYKHFHPTQKPVDLMEWIISYWTFAEDTVFDPFMGSGTTGCAAVRLNRNFIGFEIDDHYFSIAEKRIEETVTQPSLIIP